MRSAIVLVLAILLLPAAAFGSAGSLTGGNKPQEGDVLTNFTLQYPDDPAHAAYLGLPEGQLEFTISDIDADALLIEVFSMYCPFCQREAPVVNEMFEKLRNSAMADRVKMIGIGTGNSEYEVNVFREKFDVKIPLFADEDFAVYNTIGQVGTPFFILVRKDAENDGLRVMQVHEGMLNDPDAFYNEVLDRAQNIPAAE